VVRVRPRQADHVGEETLGQTVPADDPRSQLFARGRELQQGGIDSHEAGGLHSLHHLRHGSARNVETLGEARLDDLGVVFAHLVDALAVFLERRVMLASGRHGAQRTYRHTE